MPGHMHYESSYSFGSPSVRLAAGDVHLSAWWNQGSASALECAVVEYRSALVKFGSDGEEGILAQISLADALRLQFEEGLAGNDEEELYREALDLAEDAVRSAPTLSGSYWHARRALGEVLLRRNHSGAPLPRFLDVFRDLAERTPVSQPHLRVEALAFYAFALCRKFEDQSKDVEFLTLANTMVDRALALMAKGEDSPYQLSMTHVRARAMRGSITLNLIDIDEAITVIQRLINRLPRGHPRLWNCYNSLAMCYSARFSLSGTRQDHDGEITAFNESRTLIPNSHPMWHHEQSNYATAKHGQFLVFGDPEDLREAIAVGRSALDHILSAPPGRILHADLFITNFAAMLVDKFSQTGNLALLDEAISLYWNNLERVPPSRRVWNLRAISGAYRSRFLAHGRLADLESAVSMLDEALASAEPDMDGALVYYDLADVLITLYNERKDVGELRRAISLLQTFLASDRPQPQDLAQCQSMLGLALLIRGSIDSSVDDVAECIRCQTRALGLVQEEVFQVLYYFRLGMAELRSFVTDGQTAGVDNSVAAFTRALSLMPLDHPGRAGYLLHLSKSLLARAELYDSVSAFAEGFNRLREAATHSSSWPADRYVAAVELASKAHERGFISQAMEGYRLAISLLPQLASFELEDELRMKRISRQAREVPQDAAACALELGDPELAVELLEASRAILWNAGQELRADLVRLKETDPDLATQLAETNAALEFRPPGEPTAMSKTEIESERKRLHSLASRRTELISQIRSHPGFDQFLLPPTFSALKQVAGSGPVVVLNASRHRCDALLLHGEEQVLVIPLTAVTHDQIKSEAMVLQHTLAVAYKDKRGLQFLESGLKRLLHWLWNSIGYPVCIALQRYLSTSTVPRVWWCPIGAMSFLPIHACGPFEGTQLGMADIAISSYIPTISALLRAQKEKLLVKTMSPSMLLVSQPNARGHRELPAAVHEARVVEALFAESGTFLVGSAATVSTVETLLGRNRWLHVISHGTQKSLNPLESSLALYDGPLKLSRLAQAHLPHAEFAFLSACHSAKGSTWIPDESMHLAAGMIFAGFRSVVATSWAIADRDAPYITRVFYTHLMGKRSPPSATDAAEALHIAVLTLRRSGVPVYRWVPFIHLGA